MIAYKNLYIDGVFFHNKADIDAFLKNKLIEAYKTAVALFIDKHTMAISMHCDKILNRWDGAKMEYERTIHAGDMVMLLNLYRYIKDNDIQNDFINPMGRRKEQQ